MEQEIQRKVLTTARMAEEMGIQSSLTDDDVKEYLEQVIGQETKGQRLRIIQNLEFYLPPVTH